MDLNDPSLSSQRTSATTSSMTGRESAASSVTSIGGYDFLPPIRSPSPLGMPRDHDSMGDEDEELNWETDEQRKYSAAIQRESFSKPLPDAPISIFDRLQSPSSFIPTRRAPIPPMLQS